MAVVFVRMHKPGRSGSEEHHCRRARHTPGGHGYLVPISALYLTFPQRHPPVIQSGGAEVLSMFQITKVGFGFWIGMLHRTRRRKQAEKYGSTGGCLLLKEANEGVERL